MTGELRETEKVLILCVDRDDDIGTKAKIETPIIGRDKVLNAATKLILADPEEPDANAAFEATRLHDELVEESKEVPYEVAIIAGSRRGGLEADRKISRELNKVLEIFPADKVILVSDGYADEVVIPVVQSRIPIMSIRRVIVKHSASIEESWAVFSRYLRRLMEEPFYSRVILGMPGLLIIALAILWFYRRLEYAGITMLIFIGVALFIKGFGVDKAFSALIRRIKSFSLPPPHELLRIWTSIAGTIICVVAGYIGASYVVAEYKLASIEAVVSSFSLIIADFVEKAIGLVVLGACVFLLGNCLYYYIIRNPKFLQTIVGIVLFAITYPIALELSYLLKEVRPSPSLAFWLTIGILALFLSISVVYGLHHKVVIYLKKLK